MTPTVLPEVSADSKAKIQAEAESFLLRALEALGPDPQPLKDVLEMRARLGVPSVSPSALRSALWHLASVGQIDFTSDWRLKKVG